MKKSFRNFTARLPFFPFISLVFEGMNTHVEFVSYQQRYRIDIYQDHNDECGTNGTVNLIEVSKMIDPERKKKTGQ